jgi:hypothetical protein
MVFRANAVESEEKPLAEGRCCHSTISSYPMRKNQFLKMAKEQMPKLLPIPMHLH